MIKIHSDGKNLAARLEPEMSESKRESTESLDLALKILSYLADHPEAEDSLEGIVEWWLLERDIQCQTSLVQNALQKLVSSGAIVCRITSDSRTYYRINPLVKTVKPPSNQTH